jgi:hypothetical protein
MAYSIGNPIRCRSLFILPYRGCVKVSVRAESSLRNSLTSNREGSCLRLRTFQEYSDLKLSVEGHTDSQGDESYNLGLSDRRAASVLSYLIQEFGIDGARLSSRGLGETQPVAPNDTAEGRQQNRRVELVRIDR